MHFEEYVEDVHPKKIELYGGASLRLTSGFSHGNSDSLAEVLLFLGEHLIACGDDAIHIFKLAKERRFPDFALYDQREVEEAVAGSAYHPFKLLTASRGQGASYYNVVICNPRDSRVIAACPALGVMYRGSDYLETYFQLSNSLKAIERNPDSHWSITCSQPFPLSAGQRAAGRMALTQSRPAGDEHSDSAGTALLTQERQMALL